MMTDRQTLTLRAKILGALLREARLASGKSLRETAAVLGIPPGTLSAYEHGRRAISLPELEALAFHLDVPLSQFLEGHRPSAEDQRAALDLPTLVRLRQRVIGARLRARREEFGLSLKALAGELGLPTGRLRAYERGMRPIPLPELEALAERLDLALQDLLEEEGPIGEWHLYRAACDALAELPADLKRLIADPEARPYLDLALRLRRLDGETLRQIAQALEALAP